MTETVKTLLDQIKETASLLDYGDQKVLWSLLVEQLTSFDERLKVLEEERRELHKVVTFVTRQSSDDP